MRMAEGILRAVVVALVILYTKLDWFAPCNCRFILSVKLICSANTFLVLGSNHIDFVISLGFVN